MSVRHPIISVTGSSGAGTTSVKRTFERIFKRERSTKLPQNIRRPALKKLLVLDAADSLGDLRIPPGNRLEKLSGNRKGQHSIRINDQWRVVFCWTDAGPTEVDIRDYH